MQVNIERLATDTFYHIYNRGYNGENIFKEERNYTFFLEKYIKYIQPVAATHAYCLPKNHFHILIRTKSEEEVRRHFPNKLNYDTDKIISLQLGHLFNGYLQAINKRFERTGSLFETPFKRVAIIEEDYLTKVIYYIHFNPQKHRFINDFRNYPYSSYPIYLSNQTTRLERGAKNPDRKMQAGL